MTGELHPRRSTQPHLRVMVVDDHAAVRESIRKAIEGADIEVVAEAGTGREAVTLAPIVDPDLLLIDVDMPDLDGIEVVRAVAPALPGTVIVMLTVSDAPADVFRAIEAGAQGYLIKGLAPAALRRAVRAAARGELAMPRELAGQVVSLIAGAPPLGRPLNPGMELLSPRELEVLRLLADGLTDREIAEILTVSARTAEAHVGSILRKLGARNRAAATRAYLER